MFQACSGIRPKRPHNTTTKGKTICYNFLTSKNSLSVVQAENGFIVNEHFNGMGSGGQHIAPDLETVNEIIKAYFAKE